MSSSISKPWLNTVFVDDATTAGQHNFFSYTGKRWWFSTDTPGDNIGTWYALDSVSGLSSIDGSETVTLSFHGTGAIFYGSLLSAGDTCTYGYSIDGGPLKDITIRSGERGFYNVTSLPNGDHTVLLTNTAELSLRVDYALIITEEETPIEEDAIAFMGSTSPEITYEGFKMYPGNQGDLDSMHTTHSGDSLQFEFAGNSLHIQGSWWDELYTNPSGNIVISTSLDNATPTIKTFEVRKGFTVDEAWFEMKMNDLPPSPSGGKHTFNLTVLTVHPTAQTFMMNSFLYSNSSTFATRTAQTPGSSSSPRPTSTSQPGPNNNSFNDPRRHVSSFSIIIIIAIVGFLIIGTAVAGFIWWRNRKSKRLRNMNLASAPPPGPYMYQQMPLIYPQTPYADSQSAAGPSTHPGAHNPYGYHQAPSSDQVEKEPEGRQC